MVDFIQNSSPCKLPNGAPYRNAPNLCNCLSGFAPSDKLYADCDVAAHCPGRVTSGAHIGDQPKRPMVIFRDDTLIVKQVAPIVEGRRDSLINFAVPNLPADTYSPNVTAGTVAASTCAYPGVIWKKTVSKLDCQDVFEATLPWSQNVLCGFVHDHTADATYNTYNTTSTHIN